MQLVSHYLQRPSKNRLPSEKRIIPFFDLCFAIQAVCIIVHIVRVVDASNQTLQHGIIVPQPFKLAEYLDYKLSGCSMTTTSSSLYAFYNVEVVVNEKNLMPIFADMVWSMRLAMFVGSVTGLMGLVNRGFVENNVFVILTLRNVVLWKDVVSACELLLLGYMFQIAVSIEYPRVLLREYFVYCGVERRVALPFIDVIPLYVFSAAGYLTYVVSGMLYFIHTIPKYGVLDAEEVEQYKERLRRQKEASAEMQVNLHAAKEAHARLHFQMMEANYLAAAPGGAGGTAAGMNRGNEVVL